MTTDDKFRYGKLQNVINIKTTKISALSSRKIHQYEYLTGEEIIPPWLKSSDWKATFAYSSLGKAF